MEFKVIIYILIAIGYFVVNNYKKLVAENRKRVFNAPPVASPEPAQPNPVPAQRKSVLKTLKRQPMVRKEHLARKPVVEIPEPVSLEKKFEVRTSNDFFTPLTEAQIQKKETSKLSSSVLRHAILYGELINKPAWTKY